MPINRSLTMDTQSSGASAPSQATQPAVFQFHSVEVRTVDRDGQIWFVAGDVAKALDYADTTHLTRVLDADEKGLHIVETLGGNQQVTIISESGLYHALLKSRKPLARPFRRWVTEEVLPAIRRTGAYSPAAPVPALLPPGTRLLLAFDDDGQYRVKVVPNDALVVTMRQIVEIIREKGYVLAKPVAGEDILL
jgi:hypothetical protein